jgi:hypothetical protein
MFLQNITDKAQGIYIGGMSAVWQPNEIKEVNLEGLTVPKAFKEVDKKAFDAFKKTQSTFTENVKRAIPEGMAGVSTVGSVFK